MSNFQIATLGVGGGGVVCIKNKNCFQRMDGNPTTHNIDSDPPRNFTPSSWDPPNSYFGYQRCGITEQSELAQHFLCNLNRKRNDAGLDMLKWHYGLGKHLDTLQSNKGNLNKHSEGLDFIRCIFCNM